MYQSRAKALLRCVESLIRSRSGIEKYLEIASATTLALFSVNPSLIVPFYSFVLTHWPRGFSDKTVALIGFLENAGCIATALFDSLLKTDCTPFVPSYM